jgi:four helix bundle protein
VEACQRAGRGFFSLCEQARHASASSPLNLAEAVGHRGADRAQRLRIARGSALKVDAALTLLGHRRVCPSELRGQARVLTVRLVGRLTRLVESARS